MVQIIGRLKKWALIIFSSVTALSLSGCQEQSAEELAFFHMDDERDPSDIAPLLFDDALARLSPDERSMFDGSHKAAGFTFEGQRKVCIVLVKFDVLNDGGSPAFCYDKKTLAFIERL